MITLRIPLIAFAKVNGVDKCKGQTIICETTHSSGVLDFIDILGICRRKNKTDITTVHQANVVLELNSTEELIESIKIYKPADVWI